jgi:uncharacterized phiE125 gp8 family phage protein
MLLLNGLTRTVAPAEALITLADARLQCRVDTWGSPPVNEEDPLLLPYIQGATEELDGIDGWLNRALVTQTWRLTLNCFPGRPIKLPLPPLQSVTSVVYDAPDGTATTLDAAEYRVITVTDPGMVEAVTSWPSIKDQLGAVRITYVAGYGDAEDVPEIIRNYIRARVAQLYQFREQAVAGVTVAPVPYMRDNLESIRMRGVHP